MADPDASPRAGRGARPDAALAAARQRVLVGAARARRRLPGISPAGRVAGRVAATLPTLAPDADLARPEIALAIADDLAAQVLDAAAAALIGHRLALGIGREARAAADAVVAGPARAFALAHRHLARPPAAAPLADVFAEARAEVAHLWADRLPVPLPDEFRPATPRPAPAAEDAVPAPAAPARRLRRPRRQIVLARAAEVPAAPDRAGLALDAAMTALVAPPAGEGAP